MTISDKAVFLIYPNWSSLPLIFYSPPLFLFSHISFPVYLTCFICQHTFSLPHWFALTESATLMSFSCSSCFARRFHLFFLSAVLPQAKSAFSMASQTILKSDPPGAIWLTNKRLHLLSLCLVLPVCLPDTDYTPNLFAARFLIGWNNDFKSG